ncbi:MAG: MBL fold metallo-hydrolase [Patescibacteria group bacterium]
MTKVKVLIPGYTSSEGNGGSCSTISLVQSENLNMIVDPGTLVDPNILIAKLNEEDLELTDINYVFITHAHTDHYKYVGLFTNAKIIDYWGIWNKDKCENYKDNFTNDIKIIKTPGHSRDGLSLVVNSEIGDQLGSIALKIVICGDVFWKENLPVIDQFAENQKQLEKSRQEILKIADYIIPGHGSMYLVRK